ncbi:hypothetical protein [Streptomyces sp. NRRL S-350]|uniref:GHMP family kinase ATP-binding protein n=1 Tax=Streptomyces sp. NRRL S-350 TaxID=1463902 RepID=UPI00099E17CE|nr:hypothetical protein [Streptomyces sp. NRRL S-350]
MTGPGLITRRPGADLRSGRADACGTFGELLQGRLPDGTDFLVTLPITLRSRAWFRFDPAGPLRVFPAHKTKSLRLAETMLTAHQSGAGGTLILDSDLLIGKGLASSSADLVATARAVGGALGLDTGPAAVEHWLRPIEPTDGVMHPGVVVFEHRAVRLREALGGPAAATVVAVDEGGHLDTVAFNKRPKHYSPAETAEFTGLLDALTAAVRAGDLAAVGRVATRSAVLNQRFAPKRHLDALLAIAARTGALGVVCAHSGTMLGLLFDDADPDRARKVAEAHAACEALGADTLLFRTHTQPSQ